jgi:hypothetical protein
VFAVCCAAIVTALCFLGYGIYGTLQPDKTDELPYVPPSALPKEPEPAPAACEASALKVTATGFERISVDTTGTTPFTFTVANNSDKTCVLSVGADNFAAQVVSGSDQIWTTGDCPTWIPTLTQEVAAGASADVTLDWQVRRSAADCKVEKSKLGRGYYSVNGTYLGLEASFRFQLVKT